MRGRRLWLCGDHAVHHVQTQLHGKIVLRVAAGEHNIRTRAHELYLARGAQSGRELEDWLQAERELIAESRERIDSQPSVTS